MSNDFQKLVLSEMDSKNENIQQNYYCFPPIFLWYFRESGEQFLKK